MKRVTWEYRPEERGQNISHAGEWALYFHEGDEDDTIHSGGFCPTKEEALVSLLSYLASRL